MLHVCIGGMQSLFCCILVVIFIQTCNFVQKIPRYVLTKAMGGHSVKFPLQYIPIIILSNKNRGSLGVLGAKVHAKVGRIGFFFEKIFSLSVKTVWLLKYPFPAQQKLCSENIASYLHLEPIPTTKKQPGGIL